jgi:hypothetical protein
MLSRSAVFRRRQKSKLDAEKMHAVYSKKQAGKLSADEKCRRKRKVNRMLRRSAEFV